MSNNSLEEWKSLRDEVARKQDFSERLILTTVAGCFAIYAFAAKDMKPENATIALLPVFIATIAYLWLLRNILSVQRIEMYLREKNANETQLSWVDWIHQERKQLDQETMSWLKEIRKGITQLWKLKLKVFKIIWKGIKDTQFYKLVYVSFYIISAIVFLFVLWEPYFLQTDPSSSVSFKMRLSLTVNVSAVAICWYAFSSIAWIHKHEKYVKEQNARLQKIAPSIKTQEDHS